MYYSRLKFLFVCIVLFVSSLASAQEKKFLFTQTKMGSPLNIIIVEKDSINATILAQQCFQLVDSFNHIYSDYDSTSELSKLYNSKINLPIKVSPALLDILLVSKKAFEKSQHSFDISIGQLSLLWRKSRKDHQFPSASMVAEAKNKVGFQYLQIDSTNKTVSISKPSLRLDLGGIAKGYIAQKIIDFLHLKGVHSALVDAGGDISMSGAPPHSNGWVVGVNVPEQTDELLNTKLSLQNISVATSGDAYQYIVHDGKKYAHIIDPRTGYGVSFQRNVTVIAKDGATADWLATACSILPIKTAYAVAKQANAEVFITVLENGKIKPYQTNGFKNYWQKK
jgi:FAD:protein FMN transferase